MKKTSQSPLATGPDLTPGADSAPASDRAPVPDDNPARGSGFGAYSARESYRAPDFNPTGGSGSGPGPSPDAATRPQPSDGERASAAVRILARILKEPFRAATWRRFAYLVLALPVGLICVPLALVGGPAGRLQRWLARSLLGAEVQEPARTGPLSFVHAVLSAPLNLVAVVASGSFWTVAAINIGYPLRPDTTAESLAHSWGGPSLAGAWAVHGLGGGLPFLFLTPWVMRGFTALQAQLIRALLGGTGSGSRPARAIAMALGVSAACALLSIPVIHQL